MRKAKPRLNWGCNLPLPEGEAIEAHRQELGMDRPEFVLLLWKIYREAYPEGYAKREEEE